MVRIASQVPGLTTGGAPKPKPALIIRSDFRPPADEDEMLAYMEKYDEKVFEDMTAELLVHLRAGCAH